VSVFVAGFIGSPPMNLLSASAADGHVLAGDLRLKIPGIRDGELVVGVRPEALRLSPEDTEDHTVMVRVEVVELLGHETIVYGSLRGHGVATAGSAARIPSLSSERTTVIARLDARRQPAVGEMITLAMSPSDVHLFDAASGEAMALPHPARDAR
jgi:ABC-type sugar transport system ATPase subunit